MSYKEEVRSGGRGLRTSVELRWIQNAKKTRLRQSKWQEQRLLREEEEKRKAMEILDLRRRERARLASYIHTDMHSSSRSSPSRRLQDNLKCFHQRSNREAHERAPERSVDTDVNFTDGMPSTASSQLHQRHPFCSPGSKPVPMIDCRKRAWNKYQTVTQYKLSPSQIAYGPPEPSALNSESSNIIPEPFSGIQCKGHFDPHYYLPMECSASSISTVILERPENHSYPHRDGDSSLSSGDRKLPSLESLNCQKCSAEKMDTFLEEVLQLRLANEDATSRLIAEVTAIESRLDDCNLRPDNHKESSLLPSSAEFSTRNMREKVVYMDHIDDNNSVLKGEKSGSKLSTLSQESMNIGSCNSKLCMGSNDIVHFTETEIKVESPHSTIITGSPSYVQTSPNMEGEAVEGNDDSPLLEDLNQAASSYVKVSFNSEPLATNVFGLTQARRYLDVSKGLGSLEQDAGLIAVGHEKKSLQQSHFYLKGSRNKKIRQPITPTKISIEEKCILASLEKLDWKIATASARSQHTENGLNVAGSAISAPTSTSRRQANVSRGKISFRSTINTASKQQTQKHRQCLGLTNVSQERRLCMFAKGSFFKRNVQVYNTFQRRPPSDRIFVHKDAEFLLTP